MINYFLGDYYINEQEFKEYLAKSIPGTDKMNRCCTVTENNPPVSVLMAYLHCLVIGFQPEVRHNSVIIGPDDIFNLAQSLCQELGEHTTKITLMHSTPCPSQNILTVTRYKIDSYNEKYPEKKGTWEELQGLMDE